MDKIRLENIIIYAYHGCLPQERILGTNYRLNITLALDLTKASQTDNLHDTLNYALAYDIVQIEMKTPSNLLEFVAGRINRELLKQFTEIQSVTTQICKLSPPMSGEIQGVSVEIKQSRK